MVEKQIGQSIKVLQTDNEMEFFLNLFQNFSKSEGILRHLTVRHTPQQNGLAERMNQTILEKVRCLLSNASLPKQFWAEAANMLVYLINRLPSLAIGKRTPQEVWTGSLCDYSFLRIFGCPTYDRVNIGKLEPRSVKCIFIGFKLGVKGYKLYQPEYQKIIYSRDVISEARNYWYSATYDGSNSQH